MLLSRATYHKFSETLAELKPVHAAYEEKIHLMKEQVFMADREMNAMKQELNAFAAKVQESEDSLLEDAKKITTQTVMKSRVETMLEFHHGEWGEQDVDEAVRIYNEAYPRESHRS